MATTRQSNIFQFDAVALVFTNIPDQSPDFGESFTLDLNTFLPMGLDYVFGLESGTTLPPNFSLNTSTGIVSGTVMANFSQDYEVTFTATAGGVTEDSNEVEFTVGNPALWTNKNNAPLWTDKNSNPLWTS